MARVLRGWTTIPLAARILLIAALVVACLTVAAAASEPGKTSPATPDDTATAAPDDRSVSKPDGEMARGGEPVPVEHEDDHDHSTEGAIPIPEESVVPPVQDSRYQEGSRFTMPLSAWTAVTDRYGAPRGPGYIHGGIDLALDDYPRSKVYAACTGTVSSTDYSSAYGYHVIVDCGDGWSTLYAHFSEIQRSPGEAVTPESVLGISGSTGFSTGEHLHFEIWWQGSRVNPEDYLDFKIPPGTPLSSGPINWGRGSGSGSGSGAAATAEPTAEPTAEEPTLTPTQTEVPPTATPTNTPTATPTFTPTPTPMPPTPTPTATPRPVIR